MTDEGGPPRLHAGDPLEDLCRACKAVRAHTVIVTDSEGRALRVICDYCGSQHNYRGARPPRPDPAPGRYPSHLPTERNEERPDPIVAELNGETMELEALLRKIIREETGLTPVPIAEKWRGGELLLKPGRPDLQEKSWPIDTFFHKVVMLRNRLRVLEQQVNGAEIPEDLKIKLQGYVTGCYGTLTSFNVLFADEEDRFRGSSSE